MAGMTCWACFWSCGDVVTFCTLIDGSTIKYLQRNNERYIKILEIEPKASTITDK